jgi:crotonobetainyl-CoA:carnitine CoA-transferase CaiB-like acyl-CoA transferase
MCTKMLGAMGAEVIKVESSTRPEFSHRGGMFSVVNNNKKSCTVNITTDAGQQILRKLISQSDVVVENFSARVLTKYGLSYKDLRQFTPGLVFISASGVGREGPQKDYLAYGSLLQGYSGRVSLLGKLNPRLEAMGILPAWTDPITALWETLSILAALRHRERTGEGCYIDLSMLEGTVALLPASLLAAALEVVTEPGRPPTIVNPVPSGCFRCAGRDEWLALVVSTERQWLGLCQALDMSDLFERYPGAEARHEARALITERVATTLRGRCVHSAEAMLKKNGVPAARARSIADAVKDKHMRERGVFEKEQGGLHMGTLPWREKDGWRGAYSPTPAAGADNDYVFGELLGISKERREELKAQGVLA